MTGAALAHAEFAEIILDLLPWCKAQSMPRGGPCRLYCVTDAASATGMPDGHYPLGSQTVHESLEACVWPKRIWPAVSSRSTRPCVIWSVSVFPASGGVACLNLPRLTPRRNPDRTAPAGALA